MYDIEPSRELDAQMAAVSAPSSLEKVVSPQLCDFSRASAEEGQTHKGRMIKEDREGLPRLLAPLTRLQSPDTREDNAAVNYGAEEDEP